MRPDNLTSAELFSGCGGLALGLSRAGFKHELLVEWDHDAAQTVAHNIMRKLEHVADWPYEREDVRNVDWTKYRGVDVLAGGPPCQPFGIGGKALGPDDARDMWPEAVRAVREATPVAFAFENVFGLLRERFEGYVAWVKASLERPHLTRKAGETHEEHLKRLSKSRQPKVYNVVIQSVNAAEFGAPQNRRRILFLGVRADAGYEPPLLKRTHSRERLIWDQFITGVYWERHGIPAESRKPLLQADASLVHRLKNTMIQPPGDAWITVRDAFHDLGEPDGKNGHVFQPGARSYPGHTGSPLDLPAKALKAGDHGVPGGENMMYRDDGTVRYFTIRESARLMGLPDDYEFPRSWSESMRQMGNAVPVQLAEAVGRWLADQVANVRATKKNAA
ncbi:DNA cytosine methyltransferase [Roseomonas mucosa]|uniref:DNA cytosine methyltransferase n=1 Tax=Roseomonas mucosa TaxID=207340 RepID=UPI001239BF63|nr:DNA (cytosine-5-)-methyltransferase [Roseomonas mucosa]MBS5904724.1 DNA (cytosine-5-)-methyltransferase [Acetobacteraceae bacterium]HWL81589.1 DNA (cytosine-5-)-methyltransferase [Roseomonas sp.]MDT8288399.1 DNA (cytosine-5-)-methyltransferase [Roseomonas mucosa]MDT8313253.1 DNA (cytosine-5-)-methyltransferase [Roseomonas mucosa]MDT8349264.1 DNA (cytosine-5-)-methyltransferase [Roseomonas mucosa]